MRGIVVLLPLQGVHGRHVKELRIARPALTSLQQVAFSQNVLVRGEGGPGGGTIITGRSVRHPP